MPTFENVQPRLNLGPARSAISPKIRLNPSFGLFRPYFHRMPRHHGLYSAPFTSLKHTWPSTKKPPGPGRSARGSQGRFSLLDEKLPCATLFKIFSFPGSSRRWGVKERNRRRLLRDYLERDSGSLSFPVSACGVNRQYRETTSMG